MGSGGAGLRPVLGCVLGAQISKVDMGGVGVSAPVELMGTRSVSEPKGPSPCAKIKLHSPAM